MSTETVYILLGSNLGDRERTLERAIKRLDLVEGLEVVATSAVYVSEAVDMEPGSPSFLNQVVKAEYRFTPLELLHTLQAIEGDLGRTVKGDMQPRTIDLDILLFGERKVSTPDLTIPHSKLTRRGFALIPLAQIDPEVVHPVTGKQLDSYITDRMRKSVVLFRDHVARNI